MSYGGGSKGERGERRKSDRNVNVLASEWSSHIPFDCRVDRRVPARSRTRYREETKTTKQPVIAKA